MRRVTRIFVKLWAVALAAASLVSVSARAGGLPDAFTLGKCVPADAWLYVNVVSNPERAWLEAKWSELFAELKKTGVDQDLVKLVMSLIADEERASVQAGMDKVVTLIQGVNWSALAEKEFMFAERPSDSMIGFDYVLVVRGKDGSGEANARGLVTILQEMATATASTINQSKVHDADVWEFVNATLNEKVGLSVAIFRHGDTIGLLTGRKTLDEVLGMLTGKSAAKSLIASARFHEALALVETPADFIGFFDWKGFTSSLRSMFKNIGERATQKDAASGVVRNDPEGMRLMMKIFDRVDVFDYSISSMATKGVREMRWDAVRFQNGKENAPLVRAILHRKSFEKYDQFIPATATGFNLTGLVDLEIIYELVLDFVEKDLPNGAELISRWNGFLGSTGFDPKRDIFAWWSGEMASIEMPPAVVTPMGGGDGVLMIRIKNKDIAEQKLSSFLDMIKTRLQGEGQMLSMGPAKLEVEGFREIVHPSLAMFMKPVIGIHGDWLMLGTTSTAVQKCLDVSTGKSPSIAANERFAAEGMIPKGPVRSASFADTSKTGQELAQAFGMVGMFGPMIVGGMPERTAEEKQSKQAIESLMRILVKLAPVMAKIDFYSSTSSMGTYDGKLTMRTDTVTTYRKTASTSTGGK